MKTRTEVVTFINNQLNRHDDPLDKGGKFHYGRQELRELLDFLYGQPQSPEEELRGGIKW
jgi:hypothetical protein